MGQTINWVEPTNSSVGSVLIYRADTLKLDSVGSRTIISTVGAKDANGSWVTSYSDASGTADYIYRIQFWDGIGSTSFSEPIGREFSDQLATFNDVLRVARLSNYDSLGSEEIFDAIQDASEEIYWNYGDPIKRTSFFLDSETGTKGRAYNFTGDLNPVYQVRRVLVDSVDTDIVSGSDYEINYAEGNIRFTDAFLGSYQGKYVFVNWVPSAINLLVKNMAALNLLEGELIMAGVDVTNPQVERLKKKIEDIADYLRPKGVYSQKSFGAVADYDVIVQKVDRRSIFFDY